MPASASSTVEPRSSEPTTTPVIRVSSRLTTNAGASQTITGVLPSPRVTSYAVASATSLVAGVRTSSTSGISATGLKKCMPTSAPISSTDSDEVFVASTQSGPTTARSSAKTCCFTPISSTTASSTRSQSANPS